MSSSDGPDQLSAANAPLQNKWFPIHEAAKEGKLDEIMELAQSGEDLNVKNSGGHTPFHIAAHASQLEVMQLLLDHGVDLDIQSDDGGQAIHIAAEFGKTAAVQWLIEKGADVNAKDRHEGRPIHYAVGKNHDDVVISLLENGAKINVKNDSGITPLHYAAFYNQPQMVPLLLNYGADKRIKDDQGKTSLQVAKERGHKRVLEQFKSGISSGVKLPSTKAADGVSKNNRSAYMAVAALFSMLIMVAGYFYFVKDDNLPRQKKLIDDRSHPMAVQKIVEVPEVPEVPEVSEVSEVSEPLPDIKSETIVEEPKAVVEEPKAVVPEPSLVQQVTAPQASPAGGLEKSFAVLPHRLIVGSFKNPENATRFVQRLTEMGYSKSMTFEKEKMTLVCIESFETVSQARISQQEILDKHQFKSWILSQK